MHKALQLIKEEQQVTDSQLNTPLELAVSAAVELEQLIKEREDKRTKQLADVKYRTKAIIEQLGKDKLPKLDSPLAYTKWAEAAQQFKNKTLKFSNKKKFARL